MTLTALAATIGLAYWLNISPSEMPRPQNSPERFRDLLVDIRTMAISPYDAEKRFQAIMRDLHRNYPPAFTDSSQVEIVFPLLGKDYRSVGGNGEGFRPRGFDLFDHTVRGSHPAQDIFIYDRNHDSIEDISGKYIGVVAVSGGMVIANEMEWHEGMDFRGGNYVWLYDFQTGGIWYYAHLREVNVYPGQLVKAGDKLGEVGRTGFNASAKRSDTHLHLMYLSLDAQKLPRPVDTFGWLKSAQTVYKTQIPMYVRPRKTIEIEKIEKISYRPLSNTRELPQIKLLKVNKKPIKEEVKPIRKRKSTPWKI